MRHLVRLTLVPAAVLAAVLGSTAAYAAAPATPAVATASEYRYTMNLRTSAATVRPGASATTVVTFDASRRLYGLPYPGRVPPRSRSARSSTCCRATQSVPRHRSS